MADPTAHVETDIDVQGGGQILELPISDTEVMYRGGYCCLDLATGSVEYSANDASHKACGIYVGPPSGDNEAAGRTGVTGLTVKGNFQSGIILKRVSVTGVAAITDTGKEVFATDGSTLNLTAAGSEPTFGVITRWYEGTYCDVQLLTLNQSVRD